MLSKVSTPKIMSAMSASEMQAQGDVDTDAAHAPRKSISAGAANFLACIFRGSNWRNITLQSPGQRSEAIFVV